MVFAPPPDDPDLPDPLPFTVAFDPRDEDEVLARLRDVLRGNRWSEGPQLAEFEAVWGEWAGLPAVGFANWAGAALGALDHIGVAGERVLCPSNTFLATPRAATMSGAEVVFYDCNREDLCGSYEDFVAKAEAVRPKAAWIVHVGGHIAFDVERIADWCRGNGVWLLEDCAHAHGAHWHGRRAGSWGDVGIYSFYPTKTVSCGEGGMAVTRHEALAQHLRKYRSYGVGSGHRIQAMNHRMHELTAALGVVQARRMEEIVAWKRVYAREVLDPRHPNRVRLPEGMEGGYYKYIVFDPIEKTAGRVYQQPCHRIFGHDADLPVTDWVSENHWCVPIHYPRPQA